MVCCQVCRVARAEEMALSRLESASFALAGSSFGTGAAASESAEMFCSFFCHAGTSAALSSGCSLDASSGVMDAL